MDTALCDYLRPYKIYILSGLPPKNPLIATENWESNQLKFVDIESRLASAVKTAKELLTATNWRHHMTYQGVKLHVLESISPWYFRAETTVNVPKQVWDFM